MTDTGTAVRPAPESQTPTLDADGNVIPQDPVTVYSGPCMIADPSSALLSGRTVNDESGVANARSLHLPIDSPALLPGDVFTVTASAASPGLVGDEFLVVGEEERSHASYRRYQVRGSSWLPATTGV